MANIADIEGVGPESAEKLTAAGVQTIEALLTQGATTQGREQLAQQTGIPVTQLLRWVNHADLFRIKGVGAEFAELLEAAGVDTVPELAQRNAESLHQRLTQVNEDKQLTRRVPTLAQVTEWIGQAKSLPPVVQH